MPTQTRTRGQILARMVNRAVVRAGLTDLADSSSQKQFLAAVAREIADNYYQNAEMKRLFSFQTARGVDLDERAALVWPVGLTRTGARRATGFVQFTRVGTTGDLPIEIGTVVETSDGVKFATTRLAYITAGNTDSDQIPIRALSAGADGNVSVGEIRRFGTKPAGVASVTNTTSTDFGQDQESDDSFRQRILLYMVSLARSPVDALKYAALGIEDDTTGSQVVFSHVFEDPIDRGNVILYIDDGAGTAGPTATVTGENVTEGLDGPPPDSAVGGEEFLTLAQIPMQLNSETLTSSTRGALTLGTDYYLNPAAGKVYFTPPLTTAEVITADYTAYEGLIAAVQQVIDGDPADRVNFPGFRAAGVLVRVLTPSVLSFSLEAQLTISRGYVDEDVRTAVANAIITYVNRLGISGDVVLSELIARAKSVPGLYDIDIRAINGTAPANVPVLDSQIPRTTTALVDLVG